MILGIETSCDETAAVLVTEDARLLSSVVSSQAALHAPYGGVVPEVASRHHLELLLPAVRTALDQAGATMNEVDRIAGVPGAFQLAWPERATSA